MEEHAQPKGEVHLEPTEENRPSEQAEDQLQGNREKRGKKSSKKKKKKMSLSQKKPFPYGRSTMQERGL